MFSRLECVNQKSWVVRNCLNHLWHIKSSKKIQKEDWTNRGGFQVPNFLWNLPHQIWRSLFLLPFTKDLPKGTYGDNAKTSAKCCKLLALMASSRPERDNRDEFLLFPAIRDGLWNEFSSAFAKKSDLQFAVHRAGPMVQAFSEKDCHKGIGSYRFKMSPFGLLMFHSVCPRR